MVLIMILNFKKKIEVKKAMELNCATDLRSNNHPKITKNRYLELWFYFPIVRASLIKVNVKQRKDFTPLALKLVF